MVRQDSPMGRNARPVYGVSGVTFSRVAIVPAMLCVSLSLLAMPNLAIADVMVSSEHSEINSAAFILTRVMPVRSTGLYAATPDRAIMLVDKSTGDPDVAITKERPCVYALSNVVSKTLLPDKRNYSFEAGEPLLTIDFSKLRTSFDIACATGTCPLIVHGSPGAVCMKGQCSDRLSLPSGGARESASIRLLQERCGPIEPGGR